MDKFSKNMSHSIVCLQVFFTKFREIILNFLIRERKRYEVDKIKQEKIYMRI